MGRGAPSSLLFLPLTACLCCTRLPQVFVMCEDESVRRNRLAFLRDVANLTRGFADLSQLPGF
jgi:hypothetical protein